MIMMLKKEIEIKFMNDSTHTIQNYEDLYCNCNRNEQIQKCSHLKNKKKINMKKYNEILLSLGIGLAVGGILGVLFAPDKGSETRRKISESGSNLKKGLKDKVNLTKQKVNQLKDEFAESINGLDNSTNDYI